MTLMVTQMKRQIQTLSKKHKNTFLPKIFGLYQLKNQHEQSDIYKFTQRTRYTMITMRMITA